MRISATTVRLLRESAEAAWANANDHPTDERAYGFAEGFNGAVTAMGLDLSTETNGATTR